MNENYITLLEAARRLNLTKNTVKSRIKKIPPEYLKKSDDGRIFISEAALSVLESVKPILTIDGEPYRPDKNQQNLDKESVQPIIETTKTEETEPNKTTSKEVELLTALLESKEENIEDLRKQVAQLSDTIDDFRRVLENQQSMILMLSTSKSESGTEPDAEPTEEPTEPTEPTESPDIKPKKHLFDFLRRK